MTDYSLGERLKITVFGQSHAPGIGVVLEGYPAGRRIDWEQVSAFMARRAPGQNAWSTPRKEADQPEILSGLNEDGLTCGAPLCALIRNQNAHSGDYDLLRQMPRPGHADFAARIKYGDSWDLRGGGQFSGRMTAPICFAGALAMQLLAEKGVKIAAHIARIGETEDRCPDLCHPVLPLYAPGDFPVVDAAQGEKMRREVEKARQAGDSVGGVVRCLAVGVPPGLGGPLFGGLESRLAAALFGIPAVKGVEFGEGFHAAALKGSQNNDPFCREGEEVKTQSNHHGGILGGISTGMPLYFCVAFKPTPSIALPQQSVRWDTMEESALRVGGRHDPCVVPRAVPVVEAAAALVLADLMLEGA